MKRVSPTGARRRRGDAVDERSESVTLQIRGENQSTSEGRRSHCRSGAVTTSSPDSGGTSATSTSRHGGDETTTVIWEGRR